MLLLTALLLVIQLYTFKIYAHVWRRHSRHARHVADSSGTNTGSATLPTSSDADGATSVGTSQPSHTSSWLNHKLEPLQEDSAPEACFVPSKADVAPRELSVADRV